MRILLVIVISVALSKMVYLVNPLMGTNLLFLLFFVAGPALYAVKFFRYGFFSKKILKWANENVLYSPVLDHYKFTKGKLRWKVSDAQDVFLLSDSGEEYWVACGSWFWGTYSSQIRIFVENEGKMEILFQG